MSKTVSRVCFYRTDGAGVVLLVLLLLLLIRPDSRESTRDVAVRGLRRDGGRVAPRVCKRPRRRPFLVLLVTVVVFFVVTCTISSRHRPLLRRGHAYTTPRRRNHVRDARRVGRRTANTRVEGVSRLGPSHASTSRRRVIARGEAFYVCRFSLLA